MHYDIKKISREVRAIIEKETEMVSEQEEDSDIPEDQGDISQPKPVLIPSSFQRDFSNEKLDDSSMVSDEDSMMMVESLLLPAVASLLD